MWTPWGAIQRQVTVLAALVKTMEQQILTLTSAVNALQIQEKTIMATFQEEETARAAEDSAIAQVITLLDTLASQLQNGMTADQIAIVVADMQARTTALKAAIGNSAFNTVGPNGPTEPPAA